MQVACSLLSSPVSSAANYGCVPGTTNGAMTAARFTNLMNGNFILVWLLVFALAAGTGEQQKYTLKIEFLLQAGTNDFSDMISNILTEYQANYNFTVDYSIIQMEDGLGISHFLEKICAATLEPDIWISVGSLALNRAVEILSVATSVPVIGYHLTNRTVDTTWVGSGQ